MMNNNKYQIFRVDSWGNVGGARIEFNTIEEARRYVKKKKKEYKYDSWVIIYNGCEVK